MAMSSTRSTKMRMGSLVKQFWTQEVVVAMDARSKLDITALKWALENVVKPGDTVILLGSLPYLNLLDKDLSDVWLCKEKDFATMKQLRGPKYHNLSDIMELCEQYGATPKVQIAMGFPPKTALCKRIINMAASWVVFDRRLKKDRDHFQEKIPCNIAMVINNREANILRIRSPFLSNFVKDPHPDWLTPEVNIPSSWFLEFNASQRTNFNLSLNYIEEEEDEPPYMSFQSFESPTSVASWPGAFGTSNRSYSFRSE